ncbi:MAG: hypothetical protein O3C60_15015 [Planctomycetota bacterium]|nr:hypothetical protein [Planctomycetota bacterium]
MMPLDKNTQVLPPTLPRPWVWPCLCWSTIFYVTLAGCALKRPQLANPGTVQQQQMRATQYDPYSYNDVGPEVVGGRPREFSKQTPEAVRVDDNSRGMRWPF